MHISRRSSTTTKPAHVGSFTKDTPGVGTGLVGAPECGDVMKLQIKVTSTTGVIEDAKFKTFRWQRHRVVEPGHRVAEGQDGRRRRKIRTPTS